MTALDGLAVAQGFRCAACGTMVDIATPMGWRCPLSSDSNRHHVLEIVERPADLGDTGEINPFLAFRTHLAWDAFAAAHQMTPHARRALIAELDDLVAAVDGSGFARTPCSRADRLSNELRFSNTGGIWIKDETHNVAGSHKARHLFTSLLHLVSVERLGLLIERPPLAIASCGNAALAAATLAAAVGWPIRVFVPPSASAAVLDRLASLAAEIVICRRIGSDPPGDPCVYRFREAVTAGAIPFAVQGPENVWCLDGGRTIGWELSGAGFDRVFVQTGGGALVACVGAGLRDAGDPARVFAVQTEGCAPLSRAWRLAEGRSFDGGVAAAWGELMWPWTPEPHSAADGILDDETYDWIGAFEAMSGSGGSPVVVAERFVLAANVLASEFTSMDASHTGTAGLAGLLAIGDQLPAQIDPNEKIAVIFSGVRR